MSSDPELAINKLGEFRNNILHDIDSFYQEMNGETKEL